MIKYTLALLVGVGIGLMVIPGVVGTAQEEPAVKPRDPLLYGLASFALPGLGQYLNEEPDKALAHFLIAVALPVVCYYLHYTLPYYYPLYSVCGLLSLGWHVYSAIDAYETAKRFNEIHGFTFHLGESLSELPKPKKE